VSLDTSNTPISPDPGSALVPSAPQIDLVLKPESRIFGNGADQAMGTEQYRLLQGRLLHLQSRMNLKRLLVTSACRAEGKTHVSANLALTMARETDRRILLVDADIRKPDVHNVYGIPNQYGLTDVLRNGHETWKAIRKVRGTNLHVLTAGSNVSQPLTTSGILTLKMLLDQMHSAFDLVIIDSPPILVAADTPLLAKLADGALLVVGASGTPRDMVVKAKDMLENLPIVGAVLNRVTPETVRYADLYGSAYGKPEPTGPAAQQARQRVPVRILS